MPPATPPAFPARRPLLRLRDLDFSRRTYELRELLDEPCTFAEYAAAMHDLSATHRVTRAFKPMLEMLAETVAHVGVGHEPLHVVDYGCGSGDLLRAVRAWGAPRSVPFRLTGIDASPYAARLARECDRRAGIASGEIRYLTGDLFTAELDRPADIAFCSLVAHHLPDERIVELLARMSEARCGWMLVDLRRSQRAAKIFGVMATLLGWHAAVRHDGIVSFARAFSLEEWEAIAERAAAKSAVKDLGMGRLAVTSA